MGRGVARLHCHRSLEVCFDRHHRWVHSTHVGKNMATADGLKTTVSCFILRSGTGHCWDVSEKWEDPQNNSKQEQKQHRNLFIMVSTVPSLLPGVLQRLGHREDHAAVDRKTGLGVGLLQLLPSHLQQKRCMGRTQGARGPWILGY